MTTKADQIKARLLALETARERVSEWGPVEMFARIIRAAEDVQAGNITADDVEADIRQKVADFIDISNQLEGQC